MQKTLFALLTATVLMALGCPGDEAYYTGTPPEVVAVTPDFEHSLTGCQHVVIEVDDLDQCDHPSVVFGSRNAAILTDGETVAEWEVTCHTSIDVVDDAINVISPPGPVAGGTVDVQVACEDGIGLLEDGYRYAQGAVLDADGDNIHENEVSGIALFWQDGPFVNVPLVYGYGFVHEQPVPRQSIFLANDHDAVATREGIIPQTPVASFELPEGANRLRIGDAIEVYYKRNLPEDPIANYVGSTSNFSDENAAFLGVYYRRPEGEACYAGDTDEDGGYYWGSGDTSETAPAGCMRWYHISPNLKSGLDQNGEALPVNDDGRVTTLPLDFTWQGIILPTDVPKYETQEAIELPTGTYYAYLSRGWRSFGYPMSLDPLDVPLEYFTALQLTQGEINVELPEDAMFEMPFDTDVRYYFNTDTGGENAVPAPEPTDTRPLFVRASGGTSYGIAVDGFDTDTDGDGNYDPGEYVVTVPPTEDEGSTAGFPAALGLYVSFPMYIDRSLYEGQTMTSGDWDTWEQGGNYACTGLSITWDSDSIGPNSEMDFVTASIEVWDFGIPSSLGYPTPYRVVAYGHDTGETGGRICIPPQALAALPDISPTIGIDDAETGEAVFENYPYTTFGNFNITKHRMNPIPIPELRGDMVVDAAHVYGAYFFTVSNCEDGEDNDGDGLVDCDDPGCFEVVQCGGDVVDDFWERGGQCDDGVDNDGDGLVDLDDTEDCQDLQDPSEGGEPACDDGWDNDGDGWVDYIPDDENTQGYDESLWGDPGCTDEEDNDETNIDQGECADGEDNDNDGFIDGADPQCNDETGSGWQSASESPQCSDGVDNDGDGFTDYPDDPECDDADDANEWPTGCEDGVDNDGDGWIDDEDPDCYYFGAVTEAGISVAAFVCGNGLDDDSDGLIDGNDPGCDTAEDDSEEDPHPSCMDGLDNDADSWIDDEDPDCDNDGQEDTGGFGTTECNDGNDNDGDGLVDHDDPDCDDALDDDEATPQCTDGIDNDGDCWVDDADPDCFLFGGPDEDGSTIGAACGDGVDNDSDGLTDGCDPACVDANWSTEQGTVSCENGTDDDGDGWTDYEDPDCEGGGNESPGGLGNTECNDGIDNDTDGDIDSADTECDDAWDDSEATPACADGVDNDADCWTDLDDPGCLDALDNDETNGDEGECADGVDNDGDGDIDGCDAECADAADPAEAAACDDGVDNDGDGWTDLDDPGCADADDDDETDAGTTECNDGVDNDTDGDIDEADADCVDGLDDDESQ